MIVEERITTLHPGKAPEFLKPYEEEGLDIQTPIPGNLVGYFSTEIGPLNQVVHMRGYNTAEPMKVPSSARRQARLRAAPPGAKAKGPDGPARRLREPRRVHSWARRYKDHAERDSRRAKLGAVPAWQAFVKKIRPLIVTQEHKILIPAAFSPIR